MLVVVVVLKGLTEIAGMLLLGQIVVGLLSGHRRHENPIYLLFKISTQPVTHVIRRITPNIIPDQRVPFIAGLLLILIWLMLTVAKIYLVRTSG